METLPKQSEESPLDVMHETILNAKKYVGEEFTRTTNSWCNCFGSEIAVLGIYLFLAKDTVSPEDRKTYKKRLEELKIEMNELSNKFPNKNLNPDQKTQTALFRKLNIFEEYK